MKKVFIIIGICLCLCGCSQSKMEKYKNIMAENEYVIIDVRTKEEYARNHIKDAINIPYDEIDEYLTIDKKTIIFVYCQSGNRSKYAYELLINLGYKTYDLGAFKDIDLEKIS